MKLVLTTDELATKSPSPRRPMHTPAAARAICFGPFQVDPRTRELRKRGARVRVPEQSIRILLALLDRAGDVVTRDELADDSVARRNRRRHRARSQQCGAPAARLPGRLGGTARLRRDRPARRVSVHWNRQDASRCRARNRRRGGGTGRGDPVRDPGARVAVAAGPSQRQLTSAAVARGRRNGPYRDGHVRRVAGQAGRKRRGTGADHANTADVRGRPPDGSELLP